MVDNLTYLREFHRELNELFIEIITNFYENSARQKISVRGLLHQLNENWPVVNEKLESLADFLLTKWNRFPDLTALLINKLVDTDEYVNNIVSVP